MAAEMSFSNYILLGLSEQSGVHKRERVLEDVFEAVIGAIYLDSDFATVKKCILNWYKETLDNLTTETVSIKDNKSKLQEILSQNSYPFPSYNILEIEGLEHEQVFTVEVISKEVGVKANSKADTRKKAEQLAAGKLIDILAEKEIYEKKK